jgi:DNA-binding CsgD family transcriptional regulator
VAADLVEALADHGGGDTAQEVTQRLHRLSVEQGHPWGLASAERCRALLELARGYDESAADALWRAAADYGDLGLWFDHGRTLLTLGRLQRRYLKRSGARHSLEQAESAFSRLGCSGWAGLASAELARVSGRRRRDDNELTPSELNVANLAAAGLSNKEIADKLFVTVYTVEAHLSHVYAKVGVKSRAQLVHRLGPLSQTEPR